MMKKLLVFLVMISVLVGTLGMVIGETGEQDVTITIGDDVVVVITPDPLEFGTIIPSESPTAGPAVTFDSSDSNVAVDITAQVTTNDLFEGIELEIDIVWTPIASLNLNIPAEGTVVTNSRISVDTGTAPGAQAGVITYTITGPPPGP